DREEQQNEDRVRGPRSCSPKIRILAEQLIRQPEAGRIDEVSGQPCDQKFRRDAFDQIREAVRERHDDQRWVAEEDDAEEDDQILQRLEGWGARQEDRERAEVAARDDQDEGEWDGEERLLVPGLAFAAESPAGAEAEREAAERAEREGPAEQVADLSPGFEDG